MKLADDAPRIGDWVLAVGNPFGLGGTVTAGIVSARGRDIGAGPYDDFIQIDAPVNKGNSGGPTFDIEGNVIGVNTAIFSPSGGSVGIAFAIPADTVKTVVAQLKDKGTVTRGWIGVQIQPVTHGDRRQPRPEEGRRRAGRRAAERMARRSRPASRPATSSPPSTASRSRMRAISPRKIGGMAPGTTVKLGAHPQRRGEDRQPDARRIAERARGARRHRASGTGKNGRSDEPRLGLSLAPADGSGEPGVVVTEVDPAGPAADFGFKAGDVILEVAGKTVATPAECARRWPTPAPTASAAC